MVFGRTKERRVPDLSRYEYHYKSKEDYNRSPGLSAAAAYAASKGTYSPAVQRAQPQRSYSMTHQVGTPKRTPSGVASGGPRVPRSAPSNYRSYSLRSQSSGKPFRGNQSGSRANSITVKTTEVRDPQGRTQSITRRTIKRENGYEYVETTTTTTQAIPIIDAEKHFDEFSGNYTVQDDGIEELSEEEQGEHQRPGHAYAALLSQGSDGEIPLDQTSSISQFSDALDYVPGKRQTPVQGGVKRRPTDTRKTVQRKPSHQQPKKSLTEKEMYAKAYAIAQQNVYNSNDPARTQSQARQSRMGQRTLRGPATGSAETTAAVSKPRSSRISSFFQKNNAHTETTQSAPVPTHPVAKEKQSNSVSPPVAPAVTTKKSESDEEMYAQALAIAQQKYGQTIEPQNKGTLNEVPKITQEAAPRSNSDVEERVSDVFERQEGTTATKTTTPEADVSEQPNDHTATEAKEWDAYDAAHPVPMNKTSSHERKSKLKNMFEKVKQFSTENSGYQPPKKTRAAPSASSAVESAADEVNIVPVTPIARTGSTSSHGASTTRNVQESLEQSESVPKEKKKSKNGFFKKMFKRS